MEEVSLFRKADNVIQGSFPKKYGAANGQLSDFDQNLLQEIEEFSKIKRGNFVILEQVHGTKIAVLGKRDKLPKQNCFPGGDGVLTNKKGVLIILRHADCVPIFLYDPKKEVIGLVHSGWRGTVSKIGLVALFKMILGFDCQPKDILVAIGPAARSCCYDFNKDGSFLEKMPEWKQFVRSRKAGKFLDMTGFIKKMFIDNQILSKNFEDCRICTICDKRYFSWTRQRQRGEKPKNGVSIIGMR